MKISVADSTRFWDMVRDCLVEIYHLSAEEATVRVERLFRSTLRLEEGLQRDERWLGELVYHHEPINLAGELAQQTVPVTQEANSLYDGIVARHANQVNVREPKEASLQA